MVTLKKLELLSINFCEPSHHEVTMTTFCTQEVQALTATQHITSPFAWFCSLLNRLQVDGPGVFCNPVKSHVHGLVSPVLDDLFGSGKKQFVLNFKDFHVLRDPKITEPFL